MVKIQMALIAFKGGGDQAYIFLKHYFEIYVGRDGLDTGSPLEGGFGPMRAILSM